MKILIIFTLLFSQSIIAFGKTSQSKECRRIKWDQYKVYTIAATYDHATHIILPGELLTDPLVGNEDLWIVDGGDRHVFIKPGSETKIGSSTTLTALTKDGRSYDFLVKRHSHEVNTCIRIEDGKMFTKTQRKALNDYLTPAEQQAQLVRQKLTSLQLRYGALETSIKEGKEIAVKDAIRKYRYHIYTRYSWDTGSGFIGKNLISDVYDDGRFTYIRLNNTNKGLLTVEARLEGANEILQAKYDDIAKVYRIVGIYPKFILKYNKAKVTVRRGNSKSKGEF